MAPGPKPQLATFNSFKLTMPGKASLAKCSAPPSPKSLKGMINRSRPLSCRSPGANSCKQSSSSSQNASTNSLSLARCGRVDSVSVLTPVEPNSLPRKLRVSRLINFPRIGARVCKSAEPKLQSVRLRSRNPRSLERPCDAKTSVPLAPKVLFFRFRLSRAERRPKPGMSCIKKVPGPPELSRSRALKLSNCGVHASFPKDMARVNWDASFLSLRSSTFR
mmetsp:Transcript_121113/g.258577  ORF Transcript_121113/g.258577 Transcript_121113/m.258577 type:complete len:220 (-) Transcript_121113:242-901(-)